MSEKVPNQEIEGEGEEQINRSRRGFWQGLAAVVGVGAVGGGAALFGNKEGGNEAAEEAYGEDPTKTPIEGLSRQEVMNEIVHDVQRTVALERVATNGIPSDATDYDGIEYFLKPYRDNGTTPTPDDIASGIQKLEERIAQLRARRDELSTPQ